MSKEHMSAAQHTPGRPSVSKKSLLAEAASLEASAKEALPAWILLGQVSRYDAAMQLAEALRKCAGLTWAIERRELLAIADAAYSARATIKGAGSAA